MVSKKCTKCKEVKPHQDYYKDKSSKDGYAYSCIECDKKRVKKYRQENREKFRESQKKWQAKNPAKVKQYAKTNYIRNIRVRQNYNLKKLCGITIDQYDETFERQGGVCAICGQPETMKNQYGVRRLSADHDHATGRFRGLLCNNCNRFVGFCDESVGVLKKTIQYLEAQDAYSDTA